MIKRMFFSIALLSLCFLSVATPASASSFNPFGGVDCTQPKVVNATACKDKAGPNSNPLTGNNGLLVRITNLIAFVGGAAAIIVILVGALRFITSGSDLSTGSRTDTDVENARHSIANALTGLAIIVLARTLIVFVLDHI